MSIVTQAALTSLRSLKYGSDQPGGGSSGEPYITQKIPPAFEQQVPSTTIWNSDNGLIRGGFTGATLASARDTIRIGKFLKDPPRGPLFIAKQVGLQLSNPKLETRNDPLSKLLGQIGPTRIYNLGINTLAQIPINAFGGHIVRHGLFPVLNEGFLYSNVAVANNNEADNKLVQLKYKLLPAKGNTALIPIANYISGPGSIDGIGSTLIRRYDNTLDKLQLDENNIPVRLKYAKLTAPNSSASVNKPIEIDYYAAQGVSLKYFANTEGITNNIAIQNVNNIVPPNPSSNTTLINGNQIDQNVIDYPAGAKTYNTLINAINTQITASLVGTSTPKIDTRYNGSSQGPVTFTYTGKAYSGKNKNLDLSTYNIETRLGYDSSVTSKYPRQDQINLTPVYLSSAPPGTNITIGGETLTVRDLIKFRIEAVDGDKPDLSAWMIFRAYLKDISDNPNPSWNTVNYVGRGEPFYIYKGFERNISFNFQVAAMSEDELQPMWQKLNYLFSNTMPDYSGNVMRGPYMKLTIGNYIYRQPGIIKSLTYNIDDKSPWEIAITDPENQLEEKARLYELPHVMNVSMTFAPIHDFLPSKMPKQYPGDNNLLPAFVVDENLKDNPWLGDMYKASTGGTFPVPGQRIEKVRRAPIQQTQPTFPIRNIS